MIEAGEEEGRLNFFFFFLEFEYKVFRVGKILHLHH